MVHNAPEFHHEPDISPYNSIALKYIASNLSQISTTNNSILLDFQPEDEIS